MGCIIGTAIALWIGFGSYSIDRHISNLPTNVANCTVTSATLNLATVETVIQNNFTLHSEEKL